MRLALHSCQTQCNCTWHRIQLILMQVEQVAAAVTPSPFDHPVDPRMRAVLLHELKALGITPQPGPVDLRYYHVLCAETLDVPNEDSVWEQAVRTTDDFESNWDNRSVTECNHDEAFPSHFDAIQEAYRSHPAFRAGMEGPAS
eukprot:m.118089 g.118089  ORF g.118089 m.118089 type:complete len:143 (+) comp9223_c0_seq6:178-606(+)